MRKYKTNSYEETVALGERIAKELPKGSVIAFLGGMGMGKTAFTADNQCNVFQGNNAI